MALVRFIHITDTHIAADPAFTSYGHAPYANLHALVETINALPYTVDFIAHTGDVVEDGSAAAYALAYELLAKLKFPVRYLVGNHDNRERLQTMLGIANPTARYEIDFVAGGVQFVTLDTTGPIAPGGELTPEQLARLRTFCTPDGPPLVILMHHQPLLLGVRWLDEHIFKDNGGAMYLENHAEFESAIAPARERLRGVFFGHIHRAFQAMRGGVLYSSAPSTFGQLQSYPTLEIPQPAPQEPGGYCLVTVYDAGTVIQQIALPRPK